MLERRSAPAHNIYMSPVTSLVGVGQRADTGRTLEQSTINIDGSQVVDKSNVSVEVGCYILVTISTSVVACLAAVEQDDETTLPRPDCQGYIICLDCPQEWSKAGYLVFAMISHIKLHLRRNPAHFIVHDCRACGTHHSISDLLEGMGYARRQWGGRRPGAGAPRGNLNALTNGSRSSDPDLRRFMQELEPERRLSTALFLRQFRKGDME